MKEYIPTIHLNTIAEAAAFYESEKPFYPLLSIDRFEDIKQKTLETRTRLISDFYIILLKEDCPGKIRYGQTIYDFDEGIMSFYAPKQINIVDAGEFLATKGWMLNVHPDFFRSSGLHRKIKEYGFFEYATNEALILSEKEELAIRYILRQIREEYEQRIDSFSQDVVISQIELLLNYCNRFYNRQFITRSVIHHHLQDQIEALIEDYINHQALDNGLPTVRFLAAQLNYTPKYLSDYLKQITGQSALSLIHKKLIEHAKDQLASTQLSVSEIAYELGFEHAQGFNKLFKNKTGLTPLEFRAQFN
ncbi:MAG: helix-turn-helix domain-containing protein [Sphingobacterium sp.]